jgi:hypothetical protein
LHAQVILHGSSERCAYQTNKKHEDKHEICSAASRVIKDDDFKPIIPKAIVSMTTADQIYSGLPIPKVTRVKIFSPDDFEGFVEEWASSLNDIYVKVRRFAGSGDMGIDIAGFTTNNGFASPWDNYQCKRYDHPLRPSDIYKEIGKIIYYSWRGEFSVPRKHYFSGSQDIGTSLEKLLANTTKLKQAMRDNWEQYCQKTTGITSTKEIPLEGALLTYFNAFDFSIFSSKSVLELVQQHAKTPFHAVRFGGDLPPRPVAGPPPSQPGAHESRYVRQLLDAYGDHTGAHLKDISALGAHPGLSRDFSRQRERFYHAEALRNFSRDTVPEGTFAALQEEIFQGVVDICESTHPNGFERMKATISQASQIISTSNALAPATRVPDRQGVCHQLANEDRLKWIQDDA